MFKYLKKKRFYSMKEMQLVRMSYRIGLNGKLEMPCHQVLFLQITMKMDGQLLLEGVSVFQELFR